MRSIEKSILPFLLLLASTSYAWAVECPIPNPDLSDRFRALKGVQVSRSMDLVDPDSEEPVRRYVLVLDGGTTAIVQQKNCQMQNLSVMLLASGDNAADAAGPLAKLLKSTVTWTESFEKVDIEPILARALASKAFSSDATSVVTESLNDKVSASAESSEVVLSMAPLDHNLMPYGRAVAITIAVGGE